MTTSLQTTTEFDAADLDALVDTILRGAFDNLLGHTIAGDGKRAPKQHHASLRDEWQMLLTDCHGRPAIAFAPMVLTVPIRRNRDLDHHLSLFYELWDQHGSALLEALDTRWLVSCCDTFIDHPRSEAERAYALCGSLFVNTLKLHETELLYSPAYPDLQGDVQRINARAMMQRRGRVMLFDGLTPFRFGATTGDMIKNLSQRVDRSGTDAPYVTAHIVTELFRRANTKNTVFTRMKRATKAALHRAKP